jgi:Icc protein
MNLRLKFYTIISSLSFLCGCNSVEYSPVQVFDNDSPLNLNSTNLERISKIKNDDTVRFVFSADFHGSYDNTTDFVKNVNAKIGLDFVILNGDLSDYGLLRETEGITKLITKLKVPFLGVVGNHDLIANGGPAFKRMYGELNFSFVFDRIKFVCHDTNSREYEFNGKVPDLGWLKDEMKPEPGVDHILSVAHVPPSFDLDRRLEKDYLTLLNSNVLASLYAHKHRAGVFYYTVDNNSYKAVNEGKLDPTKTSPPSIITGAIVKREYLIVEIINGKIDFEIVNY